MGLLRHTAEPYCEATATVGCYNYVHESVSVCEVTSAFGMSPLNSNVNRDCARTLVLVME